MSDHMTCDVGETLHEHPTKGGPVVSRLSNVDAGAQTATITVDTAALLDAVTTRLPDDYPSVHLWCDGDALAVTDHKRPTSDSDAVTELADLSGVHRANVVRPTDDAVRSLFSRDALVTALGELDTDADVTVHVDDDWPVAFVQDETAVGVAPIAKRSTIEENEAPA